MSGEAAANDPNTGPPPAEPIPGVAAAGQAGGDAGGGGDPAGGADGDVGGEQGGSGSGEEGEEGEDVDEVEEIVDTRFTNANVQPTQALSDSYYYDLSLFTREPADDGEVSSSSFVSLYYSFGLQADRRNNVHYLEDDVIVYAAGNAVHIVNLKTMEQQFVHGLDGGGVGALCVHPDRRYFAVGEKGHLPNVYVYEYPSLKLFRVLRRGTDKAYSDMTFSPSGDKLATVGSDPDYMLTVWNWRDELILLRSKAFSQEVYNVTFAPGDEGQLVTSGMGHIKFWKMASTFTGLKLQGDIGKFGAVELTDILGYCQLPDGKVVSGTEAGQLLLWEGNLIKAQLGGPGGAPCHKGSIEVVMHLGKEIVTAGSDGYLRFWDFDAIDIAESSIDGGMVVELKPLDEIHVGENVHVKSLSRSDKSWLMQDGAGAVWQLSLPSYHAEKVFTFHAGAVRAVDTAPTKHLVATAGADGSVRLYDYFSRKLLLSSHFPAGASALVWVPQAVEKDKNVVCAGFDNGVVRVLEATRSDFVLASVFKPHTGAVNCMAYAPDGRMLVTGGEDGLIFFLDVKKEYSPIGFVNVGSSVSSVAWTADASHVLACTAAGTAVEYAAPTEEDEIDTTKSFEITLQSRTYTFRGVGKRDDDGNLDESTTGVGLSTSAADMDGPYEPNAILSGMYVQDGSGAGSSGNFLLSVDGTDAGYVYECSFEDEMPVKATPTADGVAAPSIRFSPSGKYLLAGMEDGSLVVRQPSRSQDEYYRPQIHDSGAAAVTDACMSYDDAFLFTVAADGTFFVHRIASMDATSSLLGAAPAAAELPATASVATVAEDITADDEYSIEQAKLKREHDKKVAAAELKKQAVRAALDEVRTYFERLKSRNDKAPEEERVPASEFEMYPELHVALRKENEEKVEQMSREMAWTTERHRVALAKWKRRYLDDVEVERIVLHCFKEAYNVSTFRLTRLPPELQKELDDVHELIAAEDRAQRDAEAAEAEEQEEQERQEREAREAAEAEAREKAQREAAAAAKAAAKPKKKQAVAQQMIASSLNKAEVQRQRRANRKEEWESFNQTKPNETFAYEEDVQAVWMAETNMGDFKLKSDPEYIVPENQRVDDVKKRRQMILLEESRHDMMHEFNKRVLDLRALKYDIIKSVAKDNARIREINGILGVKENPFEPGMQPEEEPERRYEYDDAALDAFQIKQARRAEEERIAKESAGGGRGGGFGGFGGFGGGGDETGGDAASPGATARHAAPSTSGGGLAAGGGGASFDGPSRSGSPTHKAGLFARREVPLSPLEQEEKDLYFKRLAHEKATLETRVAETIRSFDQAIYELRIERFRLAADMKSTDLKMLILHKELQLLTIFGKQDTLLSKKHASKLIEKNDIMNKIYHCQEKLQAKKDELVGLSAQEDELRVQFQSIVGEQNPFYDALSKIFKKRIKRAKKKARGDVDADGMSDSDFDDDFDSDFDDSDLDEEEEEEEEMCPSGCNPDIYNQVIDLRERRLDQQEQLSDFQKAVENLVKENEALVKKEKVIDAALKQIEKEIQAFQSQKQREMNELSVVVPLKMEQVTTTKPGGRWPVMPLENEPMERITSLVFTRDRLARLQNRIRELGQETRNEKKRLRGLKMDLTNSQKEQKARRDRIMDLSSKVRDVQLLKFGQEVDLENLERLSVNRLGEEMKVVLAKEDADRDKNLSRWEAQIAMAKVELANVTNNNTNLLNSLLHLSTAQTQLETKLEGTGNLNAEDDISSKRLQESRKTLKQVLLVQSEEIESLKGQLLVLRSKSGSLFS